MFFNFAACGDISYTLVYNSPYILAVTRQVDAGVCPEQTCVRLLIDHDPCAVLGQVVSESQTVSIVLNASDSAAIATLCRDMVICVSQGVWAYTPEMQQALNAQITPYLDAVWARYLALSSPPA